MRQELWIPGPLPGMNETIAAAKGFGGRGYGYSKIKHRWTEAVQLLAKAAQLKPVSSARFSFVWRERKRSRDPDNFTAARKFVLDGLVAAGVIPDDGWAEVLGFSDAWTVSRQPGVLVTIESDE